jgi:hypothetical protein
VDGRGHLASFAVPSGETFEIELISREMPHSTAFDRRWDHRAGFARFINAFELAPSRADPRWDNERMTSTIAAVKRVATALLLSVIACDAGKSSVAATTETGAVDASAGEAPESSAGIPASIAVDCSFVFDNVQTDLTYAFGQHFDTPVGGKLIAAGSLDGSPFDGATFSIGIYAEDGTVGSTTIYQMGAGLPVNEFVGDHGFTGLNWVRDPDAQEVVQYACFARDPADPPHSWED